jgi:hypothetical protein
MDLDNSVYNVKLPDGSSISSTEYFFYKPIKDSPGLGKYIIQADFSTFFNTYNLDDFDLAIFPMGDNPLTYTAFGNRVIDVIDNMLSKGKRVIIAGRRILTLQYGGGIADPFVDDFFSKSIGIEYLGRYNLSGGGNTLKNFVVYGTPTDSISNNQVKWFNSIIKFPQTLFKSDSSLKLYNDVEIFKLKNGSISVPVDSWTRDSKIDDGVVNPEDYSYYNTKAPNDTLVGIKASPTSGGKVVFWSVGFENANQNESMSYMAQAIASAANWCYVGIPWPEAFINFDQYNLDFASVSKNQTKTLTLNISNQGRTQLNIDNAYIANTEKGAFVLSYSGKLPIQIAPNSSYNFNISFTPTQIRKYSDNIIFTSNAFNGTSITLPLTGTGADTLVQGGHANVKDTLYFGQVKIGTSKVLPIEIKNDGTADLVYQTNQIINSTGKAFFYNSALDSKVPITIKPDSIYKINIKFTPLQYGQFYTGYIRISSSDQRIGTKNLYFTGQGAPPAPQIFASDSIINFDSVQINHSVTHDLILKNTGNKLLTIDSINMNDDANNSFSLVNLPSLPVNIDFNSGTQDTLTIMFTPKKDDSITVQGTIKIHWNNPDLNNQYYNIKLLGVGIKETGINENVVSVQNGLLNILACPNPFGESTIIIYSLNGNALRNIEIYVVDLLGNKVADLKNEMHSPGDYLLNFDVGKLLSGTYFIIAKSNEVIVRLPVIIIK